MISVNNLPMPDSGPVRPRLRSPGRDLRRSSLVPGKDRQVVACSDAGTRSRTDGVDAGSRGHPGSRLAPVRHRGRYAGSPRRRQRVQTWSWRPRTSVDQASSRGKTDKSSPVRTREPAVGRMVSMRRDPGSRLAPVRHRGRYAGSPRRRQRVQTWSWRPRRRGCRRVATSVDQASSRGKTDKSSPVRTREPAVGRRSLGHPRVLTYD
jgi:hypothetical protein